MTCELRGGPLHNGDKILVHTEINRLTGEWSYKNETVYVDYLIPCFGKIIAKNGKQSLCLYYDQENFVWDRI